MTSTPPQLPSPTPGRSVGLAQTSSGSWRLASVEDPNTRPAIFEWSAEDGCAVDDWDAIAGHAMAWLHGSRTKRSCPRWRWTRTRCSGPR
jgi:hypothetical protein